MALVVSTPFTTRYGSTLNSTYWRWEDLSIDVPNAVAMIRIRGYVSEDAYNTRALPVGERALAITGLDFLTIAGTLESGSCPALSTLIYDYAKANDSFFTDATDA